MCDRFVTCLSGLGQVPAGYDILRVKLVNATMLRYEFIESSALHTTRSSSLHSVDFTLPTRLFLSSMICNISHIKLLFALFLVLLLANYNKYQITTRMTYRVALLFAFHMAFHRAFHMA